MALLDILNHPVLRAAVGAVFTGAVGTALGRLMLARLGGSVTRLPLTHLEFWYFSFLTGSAALSLLVFLLTAAHLAFTGVFVLTGVAMIALASLASARSRRPLQHSPTFAIPWLWLVFGGVLAAPFIELYLGHALGPEYSYDGTTYHLGFVARYLREHHLPAITENFYANFPQGLEMLYLFAFSIGQHSAAAMTQLLFWFAAALGVAGYGARIGRPQAGIGAAVLMFLAPVAGWDASTAYVDAGQASVCFGLFYALEIWRVAEPENGEKPEPRNDHLLVIAGILAGFAAAIKYPGLIAVAYALAVVIFTLRKRPVSILRPFVLVTLLACVLVVPWLVKNAMVTGNPVTPFANRIFPNHAIHISFEETYLARLRHWNGVTWPEVPWEVTIVGGRLQGMVGPVFLLAPLALLCFGDPLGRPALFALLCFLLPYPGNIGTRFLLPALPFLSLTLSMVVARWLPRFPPLLILALLVHFATTQPWIVRKYSQAETIRRNWKETLRIRPEADTLRQHVGGYGIAQYINQNLPPNARVYEIGEFPLAYVARRVDGYYESALGERLYYVFFSGVDAFPDWAPTLRRVFHFPATRLQRIRLETTAASDIVWALSELRLSSNGLRLPASACWRSPYFNSDSRFASDGSLATSWHAWQPTVPGMFVECTLPGALEISDLEIDAPAEQKNIPLMIRGEDAAGRLSVFVDANEQNAPLPVGYRALIGKEFKDQGYTHLTMRQGIPGYEDLRRNPQEWGMHLLAERDGYLLCAFD